MLKVEDKLHIEAPHPLHDHDITVLSLLYQPLIGHDALLLYELFHSLAMGNRSVKNHLLVQKLSSLSMELIEKNRIILEKYMLMKTYYIGTENRYIYHMALPMDGVSFLRHEVFGRLYYKKVGKQAFEFAKQHFANNIIDKTQVQDISSSLEQVLADIWRDKDEDIFNAVKPKKESILEEGMALMFNYERFLSGLSDLVFPQNQRTAANLRLIGELATIHGISEKRMRELVGQCMDLSSNTLNTAKLKQRTRKEHSDITYESNADPYDMPSIIFLKNLQHGIEPNASDKNLIMILIRDYKLNQDVINVLLEYVLKQQQQKLSRAYVEKIASSWVRLNLDTHEKALTHIKNQEQKDKGQKRVNRDMKLPKWYLEQQGTNEEKKETKEEHQEIDEAKLREKLRKLGG